MQNPSTQTFTFAASKGPKFFWLLSFGALALAGAVYGLHLLTRLEPLPDFFGKAAFAGIIIGLVVAIVMKLVRGWSFFGTYVGAAAIIILPCLLVNGISKSLPISQETFTLCMYVTAGLFLAYTIAMIVMKALTRYRLTIYGDGRLLYAYRGSATLDVNLCDYPNRVNSSYSQLLIHADDASGSVQHCVNIYRLSSSQFIQLFDLIHEFAGFYEDTAKSKLKDGTFLPDNWQERISTDKALCDEVYTLITNVHRWKDNDDLFSALEAVAKNGHAQSLYEIGMVYFDDKTITKNYDTDGPKVRGLTYLQAAAERGSAHAAYELGGYYKTHWNRWYSLSTSANYYKQAMQDPQLHSIAKNELEYVDKLIGYERRERAESYGANAAQSGGSERTKSEIDLQMSLTALGYDTQADILANNDSLTDEQKAQGLGFLAGLEANELKELLKERINAKD